MNDSFGESFFEAALLTAAALAVVVGLAIEPFFGIEAAVCGGAVCCAVAFAVIRSLESDRDTLIDRELEREIPHGIEAAPSTYYAPPVS